MIKYKRANYAGVITIVQTKRYSLWIMPAGDVYDRLKDIILRLSLKYSTPRFEPHITLIGGLSGSEEEILSRISRLTASLRPFTVKLTKTEYLDEYYRCLFLRAKETDDLLNAYALAGKIFDNLQEEKYMPHLSLMYGDFPAKIKEEIAMEIGNLDIAFEVNSIHVIMTGDNPELWQRIKEFPFKEKK